MNKIPILFLIFNRPDVSRTAFHSIREYRPERIYIAADGPRENRPGEDEKCKETRQAVLNMIDWPCEVLTLFRDINLGCADAVNEAISWFFEKEEFGIIIEDDIILAPDFFIFCENISIRYKDDESVMMVASQYLGPENDRNDASYGFSPWAMIWGWATWARAWEKMDMSFSRWPDVHVKDLIRRFGLLKGIMLARYWSHDYKTISSGGSISSWATRWAFNMAALKGLSVSPYTNLSINVGCNSADGTHYTQNDEDPYSHLKLGRLSYPIHHPQKVSLTPKIKKIESKDFYRIRMMGLNKIFKNIHDKLLKI